LELLGAVGGGDDKEAILEKHSSQNGQPLPAIPKLE